MERKIAAQNETLQSQFPRAAAVLAPIPLESTAARRLLRRDEAIVTTMTDRRLTHVWVLTPRTAHYHRAALGTTDVAAIVDRLRASLDPRRRAAAGAPQPYPLDLAASLYGHLFAPARAALDGVSHVFHAPDGALRDLPLSVLVADLARSRDDSEIGPEMEIDQGSSGSIPDTGANTEFAAYREVVWFIDKYSHSRLPSPISLRDLRANARTSGASENFVGIGDPALSDRSKLGGLRLPARSGVTIRDIVGGLGAGEKKLFLGPRARESVLGSMRLKRYRTIAFATPGAVAGKPPGRTEPALILSTPDRAREKSDGVLTASEIARLDLDADLVVLDVPAPGGETGTAWLSELAQAFLRAGARSVMVSRWPVERQAAISFTKGVLEKRNGDGPHVLAGLLQRSALEILNDETGPARFAHPTHWGAFSIIGDGGQRY